MGLHLDKSPQLKYLLNNWPGSKIHVRAKKYNIGLEMQMGPLTVSLSSSPTPMIKHIESNVC